MNSKQTWSFAEGYCQFKAKFQTLMIKETLSAMKFCFVAKIQWKSVLCLNEMLLNRPQTFNWIFNQTFDERSLVRTNNEIHQIPFVLLLHNTLSVHVSICLPVYLSLSLLLGHRPSTTVHQRSFSGPSFLIGSMSGQSFWCQPHGHNASCSLVAPSFPYPGDSSQGPFLVTLNVGLHRVCPVHLHHLISSYAGIWLFSLQRSVLLKISGQQICRILLRQLLMNVWTFSTVW